MKFRIVLQPVMAAIFAIMSGLKAALHFPGEALIAAFLLVILPYVILRGLVNRLASRR